MRLWLKNSGSTPLGGPHSGTAILAKHLTLPGIHPPGCEQYERGNHFYSAVLGLHGAQEGGGPPCGGTCLVCFILHLFDIVTQVCWATRRRQQWWVRPAGRGGVS